MAKRLRLAGGRTTVRRAPLRTPIRHTPKLGPTTNFPKVKAKLQARYGFDRRVPVKK